MSHDESVNRESGGSATHFELPLNIFSSSDLLSITEGKNQCGSPAFDSGNFSYSPNRSDAPSSCFSEEDNNSTISSCNSVLGIEYKSSDGQDDKNRYLTSALREIDHLRSELGRCKKSESWYKNELKAQKKSRLDLLEKLYLSERKYITENRNLQDQCEASRLAYEELSKRSENEKEKLIKQLQEANNLLSSRQSKDDHSQCTTEGQLKFELEKQNRTVTEQEQIIEILRKQKQVLLKDLTDLGVEKDSTIAKLEATLLLLEQENRKITQKCSESIRRNTSLEESLRLKCDELCIISKSKERLNSDLTTARREVEDMRTRSSEDRKNLDISEENLKKCESELASKEAEISNLRSLIEEHSSRVQSLEFQLLSLEPIKSSDKCVDKLETDKNNVLNEDESTKEIKISHNNSCTCSCFKDNGKFSESRKETKPMIVVRPHKNEPSIEKDAEIKTHQDREKSSSSENTPVPNILLESSPDNVHDLYLHTPLPPRDTSDTSKDVETEHSSNEADILRRKVDALSNEVRHLTVFHKVLEYEHRRELSRYELYIGTLLKNVKSNKKALENAQKKLRKLQNVECVPKKDASTCTDLLTKPQEQSSKKIYNEEVSVAQEKSKIKASKTIDKEPSNTEHLDSSKSNILVVSTLSNLMDDYKRMLLYKKSHHFEPILNHSEELIEKSKHCRPNLDALAASIDDLRTDIQVAKIKSGHGMSLMDELKAVEDYE